jgi:hypothetical protein
VTRQAPLWGVAGKPARLAVLTYGAEHGQAAGMVSVQAGCAIATAIELMRYRAELIGCTDDDLAVAVVRRRIRFHR